MFRSKEPTSKMAVMFHCTFDYSCRKDGKDNKKALRFDIFLEERKRQSEAVAFPWKVKIVE